MQVRCCCPTPRASVCRCHRAGRQTIARRRFDGADIMPLLSLIEDPLWQDWHPSVVKSARPAVACSHRAVRLSLRAAAGVRQRIHVGSERIQVGAETGLGSPSGWCACRWKSASVMKPVPPKSCGCRSRSPESRRSCRSSAAALSPPRPGHAATSCCAGLRRDR